MPAGNGQGQHHTAPPAVLGPCAQEESRSKNQENKLRRPFSKFSIFLCVGLNTLYRKLEKCKAAEENRCLLDSSHAEYPPCAQATEKETRAVSRVKSSTLLGGCLWSPAPTVSLPGPPPRARARGPVLNAATSPYRGNKSTIVEAGAQEKPRFSPNLTAFPKPSTPYTFHAISNQNVDHPKLHSSLGTSSLGTSSSEEPSPSITCCPHVLRTPPASRAPPGSPRQHPWPARHE